MTHRPFQWLDCMQRKSRQVKLMYPTSPTKTSFLSTLIPPSLRDSFFRTLLCLMMFVILLCLLSSQLSVFPAVQAASSSSSVQRSSITLTQIENLSTAQHACGTLANPDNTMCLYFTNPGIPIPGDELRHTISEALTDVQTYLPNHASEPISRSSFQTNITFPETGDNVLFWVYAYGHGLLWEQLNQALLILQDYVTGRIPGHPGTHYQELAFYVKLTAEIEVARGEVEFTPGPRAVTKRNPATTILQLPQGNSTAQETTDLPIIYKIGITNIYLNITTLGLPIPEPIIIDTLEKAFTDIILNHDDIEFNIPRSQYPYKFNATSGRSPHFFITQISISAYTGKRISWETLCILYYGLRDFMRESKHFNVMTFEVTEGALGRTSYGDIQYWPAGTTLRK